MAAKRFGGSGHGIGLPKFEQMLDRQGHRCAICPAALDRSSAHIDHDHGCCPGVYSCGTCIRGLLCARCNLGLGYFRDDPLLLETAIAYLGGSQRMKDAS